MIFQILLQSKIKKLIQNLLNEKMDTFTNTPRLIDPSPQDSFVADQPNLSHGIKNLKTFNHQIQNQKTSLVLKKPDKMLENVNKLTRVADQSLLDSMQENQFMVGFDYNKKNVQISNFNPFLPPQIQFHGRQDVSRLNLQQLQIQNDNETSFLLDSATYKQIWYVFNQSSIQQNQKTIAERPNLNIQGYNDSDDICQIHDKPFEIVCIKDKTLVCSHCAIFGDHKSHSLAPFKEIQRQIEAKKAQIDQTIKCYKAMQLSIKQKYFSSQMIDEISMKKTEMRLTAEQQFRRVREVLSCLENEIYKELDQFYNGLQSQVNECIKQTCLESNRGVFQKWQQDVTGIFEQLNLNSVSNKRKVNLFLTNFTFADPPSNPKHSKAKQQKHPFSLETQGLNYFTQIKQNLNLSITNIMKNVQTFSLRLDDKFQTKLKSLIKFECDNRFAASAQQHQLSLIQSGRSKPKVKQSVKSITPFTTQSINLKSQQKQTASTVVSLAQSLIAFSGALKSNKNNLLNSPTKKEEPKKKDFHQINTGTTKNPTKYKKYETQENIKNTEEQIRLSEDPINSLQARSDCGQKKRRGSTCLIKEVLAQIEGEKMCTSTVVSRIKRYKSKEVNVHKRSPSDQSKRQRIQTNLKKVAVSQNQQNPLQTLHNFQNTESETLDLSGFGLCDAEALYFIEKASKIRKIKHLKLSSNLLTSQGFEKILPLLSNCNLINLSNNKISESTLDLLLTKKDKVPQLKMVNLSNNKLNERKIKEKISEFKKMNIVVTL